MMFSDIGGNLILYVKAMHSWKEKFLGNEVLL